MGRVSVDVLLLILLALWVTEPGVEGCGCIASHFQTRFCWSDIVIRAEILEEEKIPFDSASYQIRYKIKVIQMFKGSDKVNNLEYIYTDISGTSCFEELPVGKDQRLVSASVERDGIVKISSCGFREPWSKLSERRRMNLELNYLKSCDCTITSCRSLSFTPQGSGGCVWTEFFVPDAESQQQLCTKRANGECGWFGYQLLLTESPSPQCESENQSN